MPNGPFALKVGAGFGRGRLIPGKAGLDGSAGWVVAVVVVVAGTGAGTGTGVTGGALKKLDGAGCEGGGAKRENNDSYAGGCEGLVSSMDSGAGLGALKPLKPLKPVELIVGAGAVGLLNDPKNAPPAGLATSGQAGGVAKSEPVVGVAVPGAWGGLVLLKRDPPFGTVGVVRLAVEAPVFAPGLPKFANGPDAFTADVAGAIVVGLGKVGVGNAPKSEETLGGSAYARGHE